MGIIRNDIVCNYGRNIYVLFCGKLWLKLKKGLIKQKVVVLSVRTLVLY